MLQRPLLILLGLVAALYCWNLGLVELSVTDEARSGTIVKDMVAGHWLLPRTPDGYLVEKPPAYYGTCALVGSVLGVNEWTLRGVSILAALGTIAMTAWIVRLFGSARAAWLAAAALASNIIFLSAARDAMVDMTLTFFLTLGFAAYYAGRTGRLAPETATAACGLAFGLATLSKGPLGLALPIAVCGGALLIETRGRVWRSKKGWAPALGALFLALAVAGLWYVPGLFYGRGEFLETSILSENFRMPVGEAQGIGVAHRKAWHYYPTRQLVSLLPMLPLVVAFPAWLRDPASATARRWLGSWALFGFLLFEIAANKRYYYLVTLQPALAALTGLAADHWGERKDAPRWSFLATGVAVGIAGLGCMVLAFAPPTFAGGRTAQIAEEILRLRWWILAFGILIAAGGAILVGSTRRGPAAMLTAAAGLGLLVVGTRCGLGDRFEAGFNRSRPFVAEHASKVPESSSIALLGPVRGYSIDFYWPRPLPRSEQSVGSAEFVLLARGSLPRLSGRVETLGVWKEGDAERDVLLVRRVPGLLQKD